MPGPPPRTRRGGSPTLPDGQGFFYHVSELKTARRYGLKVIVVVNWQFHDADPAQIAVAAPQSFGPAL
jgi:hypothetical protein